MTCNRIKIKNFRNIKEADLTFSPDVNLLQGENAQGKTNLLEAIGFAAIGKSFRTIHDDDLISFGEEFAEVSLDYSDSQREQNLTVRLQRGKRRRILQNQVNVGRVSDVVGSLRTVLFCPEHLSMVKEGPAERRNYLDVALSQLYPVYLKGLQRHNKILKERNKLIKNYESDPKTFRETVEFWSEQLAHEAALLAKYRAEYLDVAKESIAKCFAQMTGGKEVPEVIYDGSASMENYSDVAATEEKYKELLMTKHDREIGAGATLWGAHKDDIEILLNGRPARLFASQGQQRSLALAMKLAEGEVCKKICGEVPIFLLDDVFSELDASRRNYLASEISGRQVIITSCEGTVLPKGKRFTVAEGVYTEEAGKENENDDVSARREP